MNGKMKERRIRGRGVFLSWSFVRLFEFKMNERCNRDDKQREEKLKDKKNVKELILFSKTCLHLQKGM